MTTVNLLSHLKQLSHSIEGVIKEDDLRLSTLCLTALSERETHKTIKLLCRISRKVDTQLKLRIREVVLTLLKPSLNLSLLNSEHEYHDIVFKCSNEDTFSAYSLLLQSDLIFNPTRHQMLRVFENGKEVMDFSNFSSQSVGHFVYCNYGKPLPPLTLDLLKECLQLADYAQSPSFLKALLGLLTVEIEKTPSLSLEFLEGYSQSICSLALEKFVRSLPLIEVLDLAPLYSVGIETFAAILGHSHLPRDDLRSLQLITYNWAAHQQLNRVPAFLNEKGTTKLYPNHSLYELCSGQHLEEVLLEELKFKEGTARFLKDVHGNVKMNYEVILNKDSALNIPLKIYFLKSLYGFGYCSLSNINFSLVRPTTTTAYPLFKILSFTVNGAKPLLRPIPENPGSSRNIIEYYHDFNKTPLAHCQISVLFLKPCG